MSLYVVFKYLSLEEIKNKLKLVSRRWRRVCGSDMLWSNDCLDEWGICYPSEEHLETITKHTRGFRYFSVAYIEVKQNPFKEPQATVYVISKTVCPVDIWPFLLTRHAQVVYLTLNDCFALKDISPISLRKNLTFL